MNWSDYELTIRHVLVGDTPPVYFVEIVLRTFVLFLFAVIMIRFLGKRELGQLSPYEFVILIAMGSALGDPMLYPDVPLLPPLAVLTTILLMQRTIVLITRRHAIIERLIEGSSTELVRDGVVCYRTLQRDRISFPELAMMLREKGIENLGDVRRAILESSGSISVFSFEPDERRAGLPLEALLAEADYEYLQAGELIDKAGHYACLGCGQQRDCSREDRIVPCSQCAQDRFVKACRSMDSKSD